MPDNKSPYENLEKADWQDKTAELVKKHPLNEKDIVDVVLDSWNDILKSKIGDAQIGVDIFPQPQVMGNYIHELVPLGLAKKFPEKWKRGDGNEKDAVCRTDNDFSFEIKTSSHASQIFGNRSYAQEGSSKKAKAGYYLTVNFEKLEKDKPSPQIKTIRFGWIDSEDWIGQAAQTGQQSRLGQDVYTGKLKTIYSK